MLSFFAGLRRDLRAFVSPVRLSSAITGGANESVFCEICENVVEFIMCVCFVLHALRFM
jgi:hypothetical protein